jgi:hypothetical protein
MDYIEWCDHVLAKLIEATSLSYETRQFGVNQSEFARLLFAKDAAENVDFFGSSAYPAVVDALHDLAQSLLVESTSMSGGFFRPTSEGEKHNEDKTAVWHEVCNVPLKPEQEQLLSVVNRLSPKEHEHFAGLEWLERETLLGELAWPDGVDALLVVGDELHRMRLVEGHTGLGSHINLAARYRGLVWEHRRGFTLESKAIDKLLTEWETTSVDFKRELHTNTADEKAELFKDVVALANTQASGRRWLIVGFDDKTRTYYGPPDPKITQEHLEQLMSQYTAPTLDIRYEVTGYRLGQVGKLEVLRDPKKLPYKIAKSVGNKKRVEENNLFVRHGSLSEPPTDTELEALVEEGRRARGADSVALD